MQMGSDGFHVTINRSWLSDVLEVKERKLEEMLSFKRTMLANVSASALALARVTQVAPTATKWNDAAATSPHKKLATMRGGRKKLATEMRRFYLIGCSVDQQFRRFESAFRLLKKLKIISGNWDQNAHRSELAKSQFGPKEIDALVHARTQMGAAKRFVAQSLSSRKHPNGLSLQTINSCYSRYLKTLKSKPPLL
jgi:hypothetical protein